MGTHVLIRKTTEAIARKRRKYNEKCERGANRALRSGSVRQWAVHRPVFYCGKGIAGRWKSGTGEGGLRERRFLGERECSGFGTGNETAEDAYDLSQCGEGEEAHVGDWAAGEVEKMSGCGWKDERGGRAGRMYRRAEACGYRGERDERVRRRADGRTRAEACGYRGERDERARMGYEGMQRKKRIQRNGAVSGRRRSKEDHNELSGVAYRWQTGICVL